MLESGDILRLGVPVDNRHPRSFSPAPSAFGGGHVKQ